MNGFTFEERNLMCLYNKTGTRTGLIAALEDMRGYLEPDEDELRELTNSALPILFLTPSHGGQAAKPPERNGTEARSGAVI